MLCTKRGVQKNNSSKAAVENRSIVDLTVNYCDENIFVAKFVELSWKKLLESVESFIRALQIFHKCSFW